MDFEALLGTDAARFLDLVDTIATSLKGSRYSFSTRREFSALLAEPSTLGQANKLYWLEMLGRCHIAAAISLLRGHRWLRGIAEGADAGNYFTAAASARGFIESTADSWYCLRLVNLTLAAERSHILHAISGHEPMFQVEGLEEALIHFTHGRRLKRGELAEASHTVRTTAEYLRSLGDDAIPGLADLYGQLCNITHPAADATLVWLRPEDPEATRCSLELAGDSHALADLLDLLRASILLDLTMLAFNPSLITLRVLNDFYQLPGYKNAAVANLDLSRVGAWNKVLEMLERS